MYMNEEENIRYPRKWKAERIRKIFIFLNLFLPDTEGRESLVSEKIIREKASKINII